MTHHHNTPFGRVKCGKIEEGEAVRYHFGIDDFTLVVAIEERDGGRMFEEVIIE